MDNILDNYESDGESSRSSLNRSQEVRDEANSSFQRQTSGTSESFDDDKDFEDVAAAIEDSLLAADAEMEKTEVVVESNDVGNDSVTEVTSSEEVDVVKETPPSPETSSSVEMSQADADDKEATPSTDTNVDRPSEDGVDDNNSTVHTPIDDSADLLGLDEDVMLPDATHDLEKEQRERDRLKRKDSRSRKELEEEERERMQ